MDKSAWMMMRSCWAGSLDSRALAAGASLPASTSASQLAGDPDELSPICSAISARRLIRDAGARLENGKPIWMRSFSFLDLCWPSWVSNSFDPAAPSIEIQASQRISHRALGLAPIQLSASAVGWNLFSLAATTPATLANSNMVFTYSLLLPR